MRQGRAPVFCTFCIMYTRRRGDWLAYDEGRRRAWAWRLIQNGIMEEQKRDLQGRWDGDGKAFDVHVRASEEEWKLLHEHARRMHITISAYIRALVKISEEELQVFG